MGNIERHYDIDWLRVLAMLMIFLFHCARFFNYEDWHVKNNQLDFGMSVFVEIVSQWIMPLFFILSAISVYYALDYRNNRLFINEKFKRLVIPLVFGIFVVVPPQVYIERVSHSQFAGSFFRFFPHYFDGLYGFGGNFAWMGLHLWYLEILFIFSLLTLPIFRYLRKETMQNLISSMAISFKKPGIIFLLALPIFFMELFVNLQPDGIGIRDFGGWSPLTYLIFFSLGYLIASDMQFRASIERHRKIALLLGVLTTISGFFFLEAGYSSRAYFFSFLRAFNSWFWLVAILGFGSKYLNFNNALLKYSNEAVLPFYILHQTIIVVIGFYIASWDVGVIMKYLILSTASFALIIALYDLVIKRVKVLRFLFGMKPRVL
ncbi:MAG: acyltransferase family protein [Candidatus Methanoperedens sp.]|nr:acyltransferase family protein [Candidatus Methanoperedens sp. BLZ2]KAB2944409.1 MAG: acyltransferase family protein [Candidatus Methanoperedens sp.]MBZ0174953.1 acyltransferase family protein [Candidatus Methanoperedens nitroreducens]MCX9079787.1 acyltransferase family protein [Candidatus Methanoperedens sp.]MCX9089757.1 acyltransferase family protein [Candidatus Methanoperedens sp.]